MLNFVIGGFVALFFLGLPLAIIALFIVSSLDKTPRISERNRRAVDVPPATDPLADDRRHKRRRIIYGGHAAIAARLSARETSVRLQGTEV
jgi:hypothetical protein